MKLNRNTEIESLHVSQPDAKPVSDVVLPSYKVVDLFGNEQVVLADKKKRKPNLFGDYDAFVEKFEAKKTTDDCYTPKEVMDVVINYVNENYPLHGKKIIRPFFPGGDYESIEYRIRQQQQWQQQQWQQHRKKRM